MLKEFLKREFTNRILKSILPKKCAMEIKVKSSQSISRINSKDFSKCIKLRINLTRKFEVEKFTLSDNSKNVRTKNRG